MHKYLALLRYMIIRSLEFRAELVIWTVLDAIPILVMMLVWLNIFQDQELLRGYSFAQTIQYYLFVFGISAVVDTHFEEWRSKEIRDGKIDFFLIRPLSYVQEVLWKDIGGKVVYLGIFVPIFMLLYIAIWGIMGVPLPQITLPTLLMVLGLLLIGYLLNFMVSLWIVLGTFWLEGSHGLLHFKWVAVTLLSGSLLPLAFMPDWLRQLIELLPFKFLYAIPIQVLQGTYTFTMADGLYLVVLTLGMWLFSNFMYRQAVYQYSSVGG